MVNTLVARLHPQGSLFVFEKASPDKSYKGGRKASFRTLEEGTATS